MKNIRLVIWSVLLLVLVIVSIPLSPKMESKISGYAVVGEVNVSVNKDMTINLTVSSLDFGKGQVKVGRNYAYLSSETGESDGWDVIEGFESSGIIIENIGNTDINLTFYTNMNSSGFIGGTNPQFYYISSEEEANSCDGVLSRGLVENPTALIDANYTVSICENLTFPNAVSYTHLTLPTKRIV